MNSAQEIAADSAEGIALEGHMWLAIDWFEEQLNYTQPTVTHWDFWNAMFFAGTIYTTIGKNFWFYIFRILFRRGTATFKRAVFNQVLGVGEPFSPQRR